MEKNTGKSQGILSVRKSGNPVFLIYHLTIIDKFVFAPSLS